MKKPICLEQIILCPKWDNKAFLDATPTFLTLSQFIRFFLMLFPMTGIKMWVKVTLRFLGKILIILKM